MKVSWVNYRCRFGYWLDRSILEWSAGPNGIKPEHVFSYIKSYYEKKFEYSKSECIAIFKLANYWCDDNVKNKVKEMIHSNIDAKLYRQICEDFEIYEHFRETVLEVGEYAFSYRKYVNSKSTKKAENKSMSVNEVIKFEFAPSSEMSVSFQDDISVVVQSTGCSESWAVQSLRANGGNRVDAISQLNDLYSFCKNKYKSISD